MYVRTYFASSLSLLCNRLETIEPRAQSPPSLRSELRIAIVGIDGRVQQRASSWHQPGAPVPKVPDDLFQAVNGIRDLLRSFEARIHCDFPSMVEGFSRKLFLASKVPVAPAFFQPFR